jgi:hypothetical protein
MAAIPSFAVQLLQPTRMIAARSSLGAQGSSQAKKPALNSRVVRRHHLGELGLP